MDQPVLQGIDVGCVAWRIAEGIHFLFVLVKDVL